MSDFENFPTKEDIVNFIRYIGEPVSRKFIADNFSIKGDDRRNLRNMLKDLENSGTIIKQGKEYLIKNRLPSVSVIEITEIDIDGDIFAKPTDWDEDIQGSFPIIEVMPDKKTYAQLKEKDRVLARLTYISDNAYEARIIKQFDTERGKVLGVVQHLRRKYILKPVNKKAKSDFDIPQIELNGAQDGDIAIGEIIPARGLKSKQVRITSIIGKEEDPKIISLIAIHENGIRYEFPEEVIKECEGMKVPPLNKREDLRNIPLVTIDGADAKDFDDAVFAQKTEEGFHLIVAIADVSYYVRPNSYLDKEAYKRGNSTYFPDRVVPMLPEALSNNLCSLRPNEDRACMAVHLWINDKGELIKYKFVRGLMRSVARLVYEQVQAAKEGITDDVTKPLMEDVINPLYEAYKLLDEARIKRGALDLDMPERQILIDKNGNMAGVKKRLRLDAHKLIEEFMILANVAAAKALEAKKSPCIYRIHDQPRAEKLDNVREFVQAFGLSLPKGHINKPIQINTILKKAAKSPYSHLISEIMLRTQSQAIYSPDNIGHFGLALTHYAHFTSPIRRYADLLVHRSLIRAYGLGEGGLSDEEKATLDEKSEHISVTERTSSQAEREAIDRFTSAYLSEQIGAEFSGKINGVTRFGLFVTLDESGADGLIPIRSLPDDYYIHDEEKHALIGRKSRRLYRLGAPLTIRIKESDAMTGSSIFEVVGKQGADIPGIQFKKTKSPKPKNNKKKFHKKKKFKKKK